MDAGRSKRWRLPSRGRRRSWYAWWRVGSARAGVDVHLEMRTLQQGRIVRGCVQGESDVQTFLPRLIALYRAGKLPIDRLVRHYPHEAINDAVADMLSGTTIKAVLQIGTA